jgi:hypothetical protein
MTNPPNLTAPSAEPTGTNIVSASTLAGATLTDKMNALAGGKELSLPTKVYADRDCNRPSNYAVYDYFLAKPAAIHGSGADKSVLSLPANSLSQTYKKIDSIVEPDTNPYYLLRVDGAKVVENIGVKGSDQGTSPVKGKKYSFHGIQLYQTVNPTLKKLHITDISGPDPVPPNETFAVFGYNISGTYTCEDILIDAPTLPGSSGISCMAKGTLAVILKRIKVTGHPNGNGWTIFNSDAEQVLRRGLRHRRVDVGAQLRAGQRGWWGQGEQRQGLRHRAGQARHPQPLGQDQRLLPPVHRLLAGRGRGEQPGGHPRPVRDRHLAQVRGLHLLQLRLRQRAQGRAGPARCRHPPVGGQHRAQRPALVHPNQGRRLGDSVQHREDQQDRDADQDDDEQDPFSSHDLLIPRFRYL